MRFGTSPLTVAVSGWSRLGPPFSAMLVSTHLPLIAMGFDVVLSYDSPFMIMLLALQGDSVAARLPHMDTW